MGIKRVLVIFGKLGGEQFALDIYRNQDLEIFTKVSNNYFFQVHVTLRTRPKIGDLIFERIR